MPPSVRCRTVRSRLPGARWPAGRNPKEIDRGGLFAVEPTPAETRSTLRSGGERPRSNGPTIAMEVFDMRAATWAMLVAWAATMWMLSAVLAGTALATTDVAPTTLSGDQEVPPVETAASGDNHLVFHEDRTVTGTVETESLDGTSADIHVGTPGTTGPVVVHLTKSAIGQWSVPPYTVLTPEQYSTYRAGQMYVNVQSAAHSTGEIRLQLTP
jgi:hypothetical protein